MSTITVVDLCKPVHDYCHDPVHKQCTNPHVDMSIDACEDMSIAVGTKLYTHKWFFLQTFNLCTDMYADMCLDMIRAHFHISAHSFAHKVTCMRARTSR